MKAAVLHAPRKLIFEERPEPAISSGDEVLIEIKNVGICHSDVHYYVHGRIGDFIVKEPIILGHECSGVVIEKGKDVSNVDIGDKVIIEPASPCRKCPNCKTGRYNICENLRFMGTPPTDGAFREYVVWPSDFVYKMPEDMNFEEAALIEPFSVALYSVKRAGLSPGSRVAILGAGTIGLMTLLATRECGASEIFITDIVDYKLKLAEKFGATAAINSKKEDPVKSIKYLTDGRGVDVVFEAVGIDTTFNQALKLVKVGGKVVVIGLGFKELSTVPVIDIPTKELDIIGILRYANVFPEAIRLAAHRKLPLTKLITRRLDLPELVKGMEAIAEGKEDEVKVMIRVR
ncbi:MAG: NAD(P)-dependent alcohol dehydrogenase [Candidatus Bathyarchaeia archaeon]|nr:NAD(P)-dependent alcohol dehydrogenase [Candidatus Bathyarchaeota archaeon]